MNHYDYQTVYDNERRAELERTRKANAVMYETLKGIINSYDGAFLVDPVEFIENTIAKAQAAIDAVGVE